MRTLLAFLAFVQVALGASHYIRAGASGTNTGASWTNAFPTFAAAASAGYVRGDTYYIAGGTYSEAVTVNVAASGSTWVYFKKANEADNGSDPGWNASYATTMATITKATNGPVLDIAQPYISFDGVTGSGASGYGIKFSSTSTADNSYCVQIESGVGNVALAHCELSGSGFSASAFSTMGLILNNAANAKGIHVNSCWIHECSTNGVLATALVGTSYSDYGLLFENNLVSETGGCTNPSNHGQGMQLGASSEFAFTVIRNNQFRNVVGSAMISFLTSGNNANHHDNEIYNNVFYYTNTATYAGLSPGPIWHEAAKSYTGIVNSRLYMDNNVFYNISGTGSLSQIVIEVITSDVQLKNNVWENSVFTSTHSAGITQSNNGYYNNTNAPTGTTNQVNGSATAFKGASSADFTLRYAGYAVSAGVNLYSTFTTYADGSARANAAFDLGTLPAVGVPQGGLSGVVSIGGNSSIH